MWKKDPKDKCIHKYKHDHVPIYIESMFAKVGLLEETRRRGKENDKE
jgi:hypothetical protein